MKKTLTFSSAAPRLMHRILSSLGSRSDLVHEQDTGALLDAHVGHPERLESMRRFVIAARLTALASANSFEAVGRYFSAAQGQLLQDIFALIATGWKREGTFVEVGVGDGRGLSNTHLLEKAFGWSGVLVEPHPRFHDSIVEKRSARLDKRAAFNMGGENVSFVLDSTRGEFSTIEAFADRDGRERNGVRVTVETATLNDILSDQCIDRVDYLSIDTEGSEIEVLEGVDLARYGVSVLTVEHNYDAEKLRGLETMLQRSGYHRILAGQTYFDAWYVSWTVRDQLELGVVGA